MQGSAHPAKLSIFALIMINVIAVASLRILPFSAKLGYHLLAYYLILGFGFLAPIGLITAELASTWPEEGGLYAWVQKAYGDNLALIAVWIQWIYNLVWYPTMLGFISATFTHVFAPSLAGNKLFLIGSVLLTFWGLSYINMLGMQVASLISSLGSIFGTLLPMALIIGLGAYFLTVHAEPLVLNWSNFTPILPDANNYTYVSQILFGLMGLEMSAVHIKDMLNPQRDFPKAMLYSAAIILLALMLAALSIVIIVPNSDLNVLTGLIEAYKRFFVILDMPYLTNIISLCILFGSLASVATWIVGPTKGLLVAAQNQALPECLSKVNHHNMPKNILILQASLVSALSLAYLLMPNLETSYWLLSELTAIMALFMYLILFASYIKLRYKYPNIPRPFKIKGGMKCAYLVTGTGSVICLLAIGLCFILPNDVVLPINCSFQTLLILGSMILIAPILIYQKYKSLCLSQTLLSK